MQALLIELKNMNILLQGMSDRMDNMEGKAGKKILGMKELIIRFGVKRRESVVKILIKFNVETIPSRFVRVLESSLVKKGL